MSHNVYQQLTCSSTCPPHSLRLGNHAVLLLPARLRLLVLTVGLDHSATMLGSQFIQDVLEEWARLQESVLVARQALAGLRLSRWQLMRLLATQIWRELSPTSALVLVGVAALLAWTMSKTFGRASKSPVEEMGIPLIKKSIFDKVDFREMMEDNAKRVRIPSPLPRHLKQK